MCLILFAWKVHEQFPLVFAANRDEFYERPSAPAAFWEEAPDLLAGRDLRKGGTWLGITRSGRFAALTNYRDPASLKPEAPSRGKLVSDYLTGRDTPPAYIERIQQDADRFNGFSLLIGDPAELLYYSNRGETRSLKPGVYGLSNRLLDTPWPKVERGKKAFLELMKENELPLPEAFFALLADRSRPQDDCLPDTGVGLEWERILSPLFIESPLYGTRSSTVLCIDCGGFVTFTERVFNGSREPRMSTHFHFRIERS